METAVEWEKVLYKNNGLPDNYTDSKFLEELKRNLNFKPVGLRTAIKASTRVSTQISITVIFWSVYLLLKNDVDDWKTIYGVFSLLIAVVYAFSEKFSSLVQMMKNLSLFLTVGYGCTPVLKSLTDTISTDTIYAMSALLMLIHVTFHEYATDSVFVSPYLSLNAAVCGAVCLASRLQETKHAFVLLTFAVEVFVLFPELYKTLNYTIVFFVLSTMTATACMLSISAASAVLFLSILLFVNILCPLCFVWAQKYKDNIYGPWDEAMINSKQTYSCNGSTKR